MPTYSTPGVYIEEISTLPASVAAVETAIPAFIGYTEKAGDGSPTKITSMLDFEERFGGPFKEVPTIEVKDTRNGAALTSREIMVSIDDPSVFKLYYSMQMFYNNGGGACYVMSVGTYSPIGVSAGEITGGIDELKKVDEPTLLVFPDATTLSLSDYGTVVKKALSHCNLLQDRFTIADVVGDDFTAYRGELGMSDLKYGATYYPDLNTSLNFLIDHEVSITHTGTPASPTNDDPDLSAAGSFSVDASDPPTLADIQREYPNVYRNIQAQLNAMYVTLPPSGTMAGIYARVDNNRGVWKAPANVSINNVIGPTVKITNDIQDGLNVDPTSGKSINAIRSFVGKGTLVWGARTLAGNDNEWRYVPVRRLFIFVEESVKKATEFVVFEPNDAKTWLRVKTMIENFLTSLWRDGALAGAAPSDAFFVNVGLGVTMTAQDILEGRMNVEIGMAAVRPAEFIILKFSHKLQES
ncbi:MAG: phage tail sheath C-terminal domain-containing protein [Cytophagales bacterium]|nr:phage tail sheath C-terminal domain-containing protein [Cytophagales bacterium]